MRKAASAVSALALSVALTACSGGGAPSGMDDFTYEKSQEAIEVVDKYLNGKLDAGGAYARLDIIYDELGEELAPSDCEVKEALVESGVLLMASYFTTKDEPELSEALREGSDDLRRICS